MPLTRKNAIFAEIEARKGTAPGGFPASDDAIQVLEPSFSGPEQEFVDANYARDDLDGAVEATALESGSLTFQTLARGSGNPSGVAPETDKLLRSSGMRAADCGVLAVNMDLETDKFEIGQEIQDDTTGARAIVLEPLTGDGTLIVHQTDESGAFTATNELNVLTGPTLHGATKPQVDTGGYANTSTNFRYGYRPESDEEASHGIGTFATTAPAVGELVIYRDVSTQIVAAGRVRSITDGTSMAVQFYWLNRAITTSDTVHRGLNDAHSATISSAPTVTRSPSLSIRHHLDAYRRELLGAQGSWSLECEAGQPGRFTWNFEGTPTAPVDEAPIAASGLPTTVAKRFINGVGSLNGTRLVVRSLSVDFANTLVRELDANAATGSLGSVITERTPTLSMVVKYPGSTGALDFAKKLRDAETFPGGVNIGVANGNMLAIVAPNLQLKAIEDDDSDGIHGFNLQMEPKSRAASGARDSSLIVAYL